jgi:hypothetical protein
MEAKIERLVEVNEVAQPVWVDVPRIFGKRDNPNVAAVHEQFRPACLYRCGSDEVTKGSSTELKSLLGSR